MKVEVAVLGSPSLTVLTVYVDVKHYKRKKEESPKFCLGGCVEQCSDGGQCFVFG